MHTLIRPFPQTTIRHSPEELYTQHEDGSNEGDNCRAGTAQGNRFAEIQRTNWILYGKYDKSIHDRILDMGYDDTVWNETMERSNLWLKDVDLPGLSYEFS